jgi:hypothetical protein
MDSESLRIPKMLQPVELWVHPEGRVLGSLYLHLESDEHAGAEKPQDALNQADPFLVLKCDPPEEVRFYNKRSIVRLSYQDAPPCEVADLVTLGCCLYMMDGSLIAGAIKEHLPPAHRRLYDYINNVREAFIKVHMEGGHICLVNKAYVVRLSADPEAAARL